MELYATRWNGRVMTDNELRAYDLDAKFVGAFVVIQHGHGVLADGPTRELAEANARSIHPEMAITDHPQNDGDIEIVLIESR